MRRFARKHPIIWAYLLYFCVLLLLSYSTLPIFITGQLGLALYRGALKGKTLA